MRVTLQTAGMLAIVFIVSTAAEAEEARESGDCFCEPVCCCGLDTDSSCDSTCDSCGESEGRWAEDCGESEGCWAEDCCDPLWTFSADAIFLDRSDPASYVLIENTVNPAERLDASDFGFGMHTGVDFTLTRRLRGNNAIEARYFGVDQWSSDVNVATTFGDLLRLNTAVPFFVVGGAGINARYTSELHNFELNGLHELNDRWTLIAGFRYLELNEDLRLSLVGAPDFLAYQSTTRNRLYGFQLGGQLKLWQSLRCDDSCCCECGRLTIDGIGKAGIYGNQSARLGALQTVRCMDLSSIPISPRAAFIGELGLTATYRVRNCLSVRAGYRMFWLDGMALASDQAAVTAFLPPALAPRPVINTSGDVFYHGPFAGLQYQW